jgi:hypothetical protein
MTNSSVSNAETIKADLVKVESLIATAIRLLDEGRIVNLSALQGRTKQVCDAALGLARDESRALVPAMEALLTALDTLTAKLNDRFGDLPSLTGHVGSDAVASAYGQSLKHFP